MHEPLEKASAALQQLGTLVSGIGRYSRAEAEPERGGVALRAAIDDAAVLCAHRLRRAEAELNTIPQFMVTIDGQPIHLMYVRSPEPDAIPLVLTHGWPSSGIEFTRLIKPLTDPAAEGGEQPGIGLDLSADVASADLLPRVIALVQRAFMLAMLLAAPFILGGFLFQVLSGMVSKVMPALPVMFIAAPGAILMALLALVLLTPSILWVWADAVLAMMGNDLP